jgi:hypothetical protein
MTLAMSQEIDFLVMQRVFRIFVSQPESPLLDTLKFYAL